MHQDIVLRKDASIGWAVRKNSPQLLASLNHFVKANGQGSKLGNTILLRYLKNAKYVKNAAAQKERQKFLAMVDIFRKYGDRYDVDWLLMAAQGYQESRLNQSVRSHVGAIGVMQVMPRTGKELKVGDISKLDPNIHAGVKYMRWMIDHYYGDEPMTRLDKALFHSHPITPGQPVSPACGQKPASAVLTLISGLAMWNIWPRRRSVPRPSLTSAISISTTLPIG